MTKSHPNAVQCEYVSLSMELVNGPLLASDTKIQITPAQKSPAEDAGAAPPPGQPASPGNAGGAGSGDNTPSDDAGKPLSNKQKLKLFMRDYGSTVIVFHITQSLTLLGVIYVIFSMGLDMTWVVQKLGLEGKSLDAAAGASTFVIAYAVNKVLAPLRFAITFACTPFIVRYLRRIGFLKTK